LKRFALVGREHLDVLPGRIPQISKKLRKTRVGFGVSNVIATPRIDRCRRNHPNLVAGGVRVQVGAESSAALLVRAYVRSRRRHRATPKCPVSGAIVVF